MPRVADNRQHDADRASDTERLRALEDRLASTERELARVKANPPRVEVPVLPPTLSEALAELAARAEALAQKAEDKLAG